MRRKKSILMVDDDESILRTFQRILEKNGYSTDTAKLGKEAKVKMQSNTYDVALIDLRLPDADGRELLTKTRANPLMVKIVLTGLPDTEIPVYLEEKKEVDLLFIKRCLPDI